MSEINLLPIDLSPSRGSFKVALGITKILVYELAIAFIICLVGALYVFYLSNQVNASVTRQQDMGQKIKALESTEQKLFLIKDRITKIKTVLSGVDTESFFAVVNKSLSNLPTGVTIEAIESRLDGATFSVTSTDSLSMSKFLNNIVQSGAYKSLKLAGFSYTPDAGYKITFEGS